MEPEVHEPNSILTEFLVEILVLNNLSISLFTGGDVKQITNKNQLPDMIEVFFLLHLFALPRTAKRGKRFKNMS